jgi:recombination protein RecR
MNKTEFPLPIRELVGAFKRLPSIGPKSAERISLWLLRQQPQLAGELAVALANAIQKTRPCPDCGFFVAVGEPCAICAAPGRDTSVICVVEQASDILPLEKTGAFTGLYHVLGGKISPLDGISPENLRIDALVNRVGSGDIREVVLAVGSDVEGEATANYLADLLKNTSTSITRLAQGLPAGGGLENADELTLFRAFSGRRQL